jgi:hypothetical protein
LRIGYLLLTNPVLIADFLEINRGGFGKGAGYARPPRKNDITNTISFSGNRR